MAAFTYRGGTENWYLSRALRDRGFGTRVVVESPLPDQLPKPSIAGVILGDGAGHFIAVLSQKGSQVTVVESTQGKAINEPDRTGAALSIDRVVLCCEQVAVGPVVRRECVHFRIYYSQL
jgi:hypothetical protein